MNVEHEPSMRASTRLSSFVLASLLVVGCVSQPSVEQREPEAKPADPDAVVITRPVCAEAPADALLILSEPGQCSLVLVRESEPAGGESGAGGGAESESESDDAQSESLGARVALIQLPHERAGRAERLAFGFAPLACGEDLAGCDLSGVTHTRHGPIVIAAERGPESEHPIQIHLGVVIQGVLVFVPSWVSPSSVVDHTHVGPPFALAPWDCGGELRLLPAARLPEAQGEDVPGSLLMLSGRWVVDPSTGRAGPPQQPAPATEGCELLLDPMP